MAVKSFKAVTPTRRFQTVVTREDITKDKPEKSLTKGKVRSGGRNSAGQISSRFRGGGHKKTYRIVDFKRNSRKIGRRIALAGPYRQKDGRFEIS